jgi:hypothetical protein
MRKGPTWWETSGMLALLCLGGSIAYAVLNVVAHLLFAKSKGIDLSLSAIGFSLGLVFLLVAIVGSWITKR